jgi:trigger factor
MIDTLREQRKTWSDVERAAVKTDRVMVDFSGECEGESMTDERATEVPVELSAARMVEGFEDKLVGASAGDDLNFDLNFPDTSPDERFAGKPVSFEVHVRSVQESALPEIDEEFIKSFGVEAADDESFRAEIRNNLDRELQEALRATTKTRVMDALLDSGSLELPGALVDGEVERIVGQRRMELSYQGIDAEQIPFDREVMEPEARRRVALGLMLSEIVKEAALRADPDTVRDRIESIASTYDESDKVVNFYYSNQERLQEIESAVLEDQVVEWILERAEVSEVETTFDELLNPGQTTDQDGDS